MGEILFLAHRIPFPPDRGDKIRSHHLLKALAAIAPVHVATFAENARDRAQEGVLASVAKTHLLADRVIPLPIAGVKALATGKPVSLTAFDHAAMRHWVHDCLANRPIDTIFVFSGQMGQYVPPEFEGRLLFDLCDVDSAKFDAYAEQGRQRWINRREGRLLSAEEERLAHRADHTLLISESEAALFRQRMRDPQGAVLHALGNGIDADYFDPAKAVPEPSLANDGTVRFVFTGQMDYAPNIAAVQRFATRILPAVRQRYDASFHIVGRAPVAAVTQLGGIEGVTVWGEVPDVRPFLAAASVVVAPLDIARGVQNKVLEAMAMARPVLLTKQAATGIPAQHRTHFLVCDDDEALVAGAYELLEQPAIAMRMGHAARQFVIEQMSWERVYRDLGTIVSGTREASNAA